MKKTIQTVLLMVVLAGFAHAGVLDFSFLDPVTGIGPQSITDATVTIDGTAIRFDTGGITPVCAGTNGYGFAGGNVADGTPSPQCVGAQVDTGGIYGTTDGLSLTLAFPTAFPKFAFTYNLFSYLDPSFFPNIDPADVVLPTDLGFEALMFTGGVFTASQAVTGDFGIFQYSGAPVDTVTLYFNPPAPTDPTLGIPITGQISFNVYDISSVPEPSTWLLLGSALLGLGGLKLRNRRRS